jgi:hypothetical protein
VTIIFVSHALDAVRSLCSRAIWLDHGRLIADGPSGPVIDQYLAYENEKHALRLRGEAGKIEEQVARPTPMIQVDDESEVETGALRPAQLDGAGDEDGEGEEYLPPAPPRARVHITSVKFIDWNGEETILAQTGKPWTIRLYYDAEDPVENPVFGIALYTENGTHLNGPNTRFSDLRIPSISGPGYVDYTIGELPLLSGRYDVTVAVTGEDMADILDHQHRAYAFLVQPTPNLPERWGLLYMPARWSFHPGETPPTKPEL